MITIGEDVESRRLTDGQSGELSYVIQGTADESEAMTLLLETRPDYFRDIGYDSASIEPEYIDTDNPARCIWRGSVSYKINPSGVGHASQYGFDTTGGSQHVTQSKENLHNYAPDGETAPDHQGAVGVSGGNVEGVDITVPVYTWTEAHWFWKYKLTNTFLGKIHKMTGKVNSFKFRGMDPGECLFLGASGSWSDDDDGAMITFKFAGSENKSDLTVGTITGIEKKGWDYLWVAYEETEDTASDKVVPKPVSAHKERMYDYADFSDLDID